MESSANLNLSILSQLLFSSLDFIQRYQFWLSMKQETTPRKSLFPINSPLSSMSLTRSSVSVNNSTLKN